MTTEKEGGTKSPAQKWALKLTRAALAVAPIVWIYTRADTAALGKALASVGVPLLACITAAFSTYMTLQGVKWWILIRGFVPDLKLGKALSVHIESAFYSIVLPSAAQDVVKSVMLSKTHDPAVVWAATWLGRLIGFFSMLIYSAFGVMYLESGVMPAGFRVSLLASVAVITALGAASFSKKLTRPLRATAAKIAPPGIMCKIEKLRDGIYAFKHKRKTLAQTFFVSALIQFLIFFNVSLTVYAITGNFYFTECIAFVPLVEIMVVAIPLTPGGLGIREGLMALLFTRLGFSGDQIALYVTISLLTSMARIAGVVPPLCRLIAGRKQAAAVNGKN